MIPPYGCPAAMAVRVRDRRHGPIQVITSDHVASLGPCNGAAAARLSVGGGWAGAGQAFIVALYRGRRRDQRPARRAGARASRTHPRAAAFAPRE